MTGGHGSDTAPVVVVGGGLAGAKTVEALRAEGYDGPVTLIGAEEHLPYERPPLSKDFLTADRPFAEFTVNERAWYDDHRIDLRLGAVVTAVDTDAKTVALADGQTLAYSALVLATGSRAIVPSIDGADAAGVHTLRSIDDARRLREMLTAGTSLAIVGGGWIGLEIAAAARGHDAQVTVVEASGQPLLAALGPELGAVFADLHRAHGVDLRLGSQVAAVTVADGRATGLRLTDGTEIAADAVLLAVGARAETGLAEAAGIAVENGGVRVDAGLRTSAPDVYAVGDVAAAEHPRYGVRVRVEHWANALNQPAVAAANIVGDEAVYDRLPYFFTDQYELGMEYRGRGAGATRVVYRGAVQTGEFLAFWLDDAGRVLAGMNVNTWDAGDDIAALIGAGLPVDTDRLADPAVPLAALLEPTV